MGKEHEEGERQGIWRQTDQVRVLALTVTGVCLYEITQVFCSYFFYKMEIV